MVGNSLAEPMSRFSLFPPMIVQLTAAGEEAGILPEMLAKGVDFLDRRAWIFSTAISKGP